ncbi:MAG: SMC-Scp complex subunit ScpB [Bacteroidota bacterium]
MVEDTGPVESAVASAPLDQTADADERERLQALEAMIFAADAPVQAAHLAAAYEAVRGIAFAEDDVPGAVAALNAAYERRGAAYRIEYWAGGYRMATVTAVAPFLKTLRDEQQRIGLSRSLMETLAIVAYRQPVTKPELDALRGVDAGYAVRRLLELGLIDVVGRSESVGRPLLYGTTTRFLDTFGLGDLTALPTLREVEELLNDPAFSREKARLLALGPPEEPAAPATHDEAPRAPSSTQPSWPSQPTD